LEEDWKYSALIKKEKPLEKEPGCQNKDGRDICIGTPSIYGFLMAPFFQKA